VGDRLTSGRLVPLAEGAEGIVRAMSLLECAPHGG